MDVRRRLTARTADRYELYQQSVQAVDQDLRLMGRVFRETSGRPLRVLREDFCGTAQLLCEFVKRHAENRGIGIDRDPEPLRWCREKNLPGCLPDQSRRIQLLRRDVLSVRTSRADVISAFNFSYGIFKTRRLLRRYLANARRSLAQDGMLALDASGGSEIAVEGTDTWDRGRFSYQWEVVRFDPLTHDMLCRIHFIFPDGTRMRNAFSYEWRLWTLPELREILIEAGFRTVDVYWECTDHRTNHGNGVMRRVRKGRAEGAWYAILFAGR